MQLLAAAFIHFDWSFCPGRAPVPEPQVQSPAAICFGDCFPARSRPIEKGYA